MLPLYRSQFLKVAEFMKNDEDLLQVQQSAPNRQSAAALQRLIDLYRILKYYEAEQYVSFDLSLLSKYHYYTGIIFKAYTYGVGDVVATGGRYDTLLSHFGKDAPAVGFMIRLDTLMEALRAQKVPIPSEPPAQVILYNADNYAEKLQEADEIREKGGRVALQPEEARVKKS